MAKYCNTHLREQFGNNSSGKGRLPYPVMRAKLLGSSHDKPSKPHTPNSCPHCP